MVKKAGLLTDLEGFLRLEEDAASDLSIFYGMILDCGASESDSSRFKNGIDILKKDTAKHVKLINEMIDYIKKSDKNEF